MGAHLIPPVDTRAYGKCNFTQRTFEFNYQIFNEIERLLIRIV